MNPLFCVSVCVPAFMIMHMLKCVCGSVDEFGVVVIESVCLVYHQCVCVCVCVCAPLASASPVVCACFLTEILYTHKHTSTHARGLVAEAHE